MHAHNPVCAHAHALLVKCLSCMGARQVRARTLSALSWASRLSSCRRYRSSVRCSCSTAARAFSCAACAAPRSLWSPEDRAVTSPCIQSREHSCCGPTCTQATKPEPRIPGREPGHSEALAAAAQAKPEPLLQEASPGCTHQTN